MCSPVVPLLDNCPSLVINVDVKCRRQNLAKRRRLTKQTYKILAEFRVNSDILIIAAVVIGFLSENFVLEKVTAQ